ncbi:MAG TPA: DNA topoisomerase IB [Mycobacteriales bacterium]|jgi:DNA topoisomerase IB|nr:DNA topoisomerase IB [Mycobacteriales bacterium]
MPRLRRVDCSRPGIVRRRAGRGFVYEQFGRGRVSDPETLQRIADLAIPPAWTDVWICPYPNGHIQATGVDAAGRRQYRYHDDWRTRRDGQKFDRMLEFGKALPEMRARVFADLRGAGLTRDRVLACAVRLLDLGFFRIGTETYAARNNTFGLATMRREHVRVTRDGTIHFDYIAKSGKRRVVAMADSEVVAVVRALKRRRTDGPELLAYQSGGRWIDVKSHDINDYIRQVSCGEFTAKDFRTWNATVFAAVALAVSTEVPDKATARQRAVARAVQEVSHYLGNTPAVCRASYIDPRVIDLYEAGDTITWDQTEIGADVAFGQVATQGQIERAVLRMLTRAGTAAGRKAS